MKRLYTLLAIVLCSLASLAQNEVQVDGIYYVITSNSKPYTVKVTLGEKKYTGDVVIPSTIQLNSKRYSVTCIGDNAFFGCDELTSISIPKGVVTIGYRAFSMCNGLTNVSLPEGLVSIGERAFNSCHTLTSIIIPQSVTQIGAFAFAGCERLTNISIPKRVTSIGINAFAFCYGLTSISIPESVTHIGESVFTNCKKLTNIRLPKNLSYIGKYAFEGCTGLTDVTCSATVLPKCENTAFTSYKIETAERNYLPINLIVPTGYGELYKNAEPWKHYNVIEK